MSDRFLSSPEKRIQQGFRTSKSGDEREPVYLPSTPLSCKPFTQSFSTINDTISPVNVTDVTDVTDVTTSLRGDGR